MQELEKGIDALLEQYKGMEEQQEEEVQSSPLAAVPARCTKRNRQTLRGMLTPVSSSPYCLFPMLCSSLLCSDQPCMHMQHICELNVSSETACQNAMDCIETACLTQLQ